MDCERVTQLLPWLVNRSLEEAEENSLRSHLETCEACRAELDRTLEAFALMTAHPSTDHLLDHALGELEAPEREHLERHLELCQPCREHLELARASRSDLESAHGEPLSTVVAFPDRKTLRRWQALALAASVTAVLLAGAWIQTWLGFDTGGPGPALNVAVLEAFPSDLVHRGSGDRNRLQLGPETTRATLILVSGSEAEFPEYEVELSDSNGTVLWSADGLLRAPTGEYTVGLPVTELLAGELTLTILARDDGQRLEVERYPLLIQR